MSISSMLVPVSLEPRDQKLLEYVCGLHVQSVEQVIVATAVQETGVEAPVIAAEVDRAREKLAALASPLRDRCSMDFELRVVTGEPAEAILALAQQTDVDVLCLGTEGKSIAHYLFSGSISEDLFSSGEIRTMAVRYDLLEACEDPAELSRQFGRRLVIATDFSDAARRAFDSAFHRPLEAIGELHILNVDDADNRGEAQAKLDHLAEIARGRGVNVFTAFRSGDPAQVALEYLREIDATGVIIGQRGQGGVLKQFVFGWVPVRLLREAPCPVVVQP